MSDHTPGPWSAEPGKLGLRTIRAVRGGGDYTVIAEAYGGPAAANADANAALIAAAPDMLAALHDGMRRMADCGCTLRDPDYARVVEAIAKAEGREP